jgi:hypothetical protein
MVIFLFEKYQIFSHLKGYLNFACFENKLISVFPEIQSGEAELFEMPLFQRGSKLFSRLKAIVHY